MPVGDEAVRQHPRVLGVTETMRSPSGGSNQSLFLIGALFVAQGTAAVPLLVVGLLLAGRRCRAGPSWC